MALMPRGNFTNNRGPKTVSGRINQLRGLRNVGIKISTDKKYADQLYSEGLEFVSYRRKREAAKVHNDFTKVVRDNVIKPKGENKNYEAPKEWIEDHEAKRAEHELSLEEARIINQAKIKKAAANPFSYSNTKINRSKNYGNGPQTWMPSPPRPASVFNDTPDKFYSDYVRLQGKKSYY